MDQYLFLETLPSGASQRTKYVQQSKVRSHAAATAHREAMFKRNALNNAQRILESRKHPRSTCTAVYRIGPSPQRLRPYMSKKSGDASGSEYIDTEPSRDSSEHWQLVKRFNAGPQSLLGASRSDPFGTYPVSKPTTRFGQLIDFGKSQPTQYRRHPKLDENAPNRPPSAYVIFFNKVREEVKDQNLSFTQIAKLVGDRWQKLDLSGKEPYEAQANAAKERYNIQLSTYKKTDSYKEYVQYLADFKAKHGGATEQKRPKLDPESSGGSVSRKSSEMANLLMPSQGTIRSGSTKSMASTAFPSPASTQGPLTLQTQGRGMVTATRLQSVASRGESPPNPQGGRDFSRRGQASQQSSISDDSSVKRSDSDPLARTASLSLSTPLSSTPPLPPLPPSEAVSEYGFGQDISRLRFPANGLQAGTVLGRPIGHQSNASYPFPQTLPSPSVSEGSWRGRGTDLRSYLDSGRSIPPPISLTSGAPTGVISLPPLGGSDRIGDITSQRTLPLPRSSPTTHQHQPFPPPAPSPCPRQLRNPIIGPFEATGMLWREHMRRMDN